jgi:polyphosphate glucokinase
VGGGVSRKSGKFLPLIGQLQATVVPADMLNNAGIVGAALTAA